MAKGKLLSAALILFAGAFLVTFPAYFLKATPASDNGLAWLKDQQNADGSFGSETTAYVDTYESYRTIRDTEGFNAQANDAYLWFLDQFTEDTDAYARALELLSDTVYELGGVAAELKKRQNEDGGWGLSAKYESAPLDTLLVFRGLTANHLLESGMADAGTVQKAIDYFSAAQNASGYWKLVDAGGADLNLTAEILTALAQYVISNSINDAELDDIIKDAAGWLLTQKNAGDYWGGGTDAAATSLAYSALKRAALLGHIDESQITGAPAWIESKQAGDGSWNENIYETALALRALHDATAVPSSGPLDLQMALSYEPQGITLDEATGITLIATVTNVGGKDAAGVQIQISDTDAVPRFPVQNRYYQGTLHPGESADVYLEMTLAAGAYTIQAEAGPNNQFPSDPDPVNNTAAVNFTVEAAGTPLPDLQIEDTDITFAPASPNAATQITIQGTVHNIGGLGVPFVPVTVIDALNGTRQISNEGAGIENLGPGESKTFSVNASLSEGNHTIIFTVNSSQTIAESNYDKNLAFKVVTVAAPPSGLPDLMIEASDISFSNDHPGPGEAVTMSATVHNIGSIDANNVLVRFSTGDPDLGPASQSAQIGTSQSLSLIAAGSTGTFTIENVTLPSGVHEIFCVVDPLHTVAEADETNNKAYKLIWANPGPLPDLSINNISFNPGEPDVKGWDKVTITAQLQNTGQVNADHVIVKYYKGTPGAGGFMFKSVENLNLSSGGNLNIDASWYAIEGTHRIYAVIDPESELAEENESNNTFFKSITVQPGAQQGEFDYQYYVTTDFSTLEWSGIGGTDSAVRMVTTKNDTMITIETKQPDDSWQIDFVDPDFDLGEVFSTAQSEGTRINSSEPLTAVQYEDAEDDWQMALLLPTRAWGTDYWYSGIRSWNSSWFAGGPGCSGCEDYDYLLIGANTDGTVVEIDLDNDGTPDSIDLDADGVTDDDGPLAPGSQFHIDDGEVLQYRALPDYDGWFLEFENSNSVLFPYYLGRDPRAGAHVTSNQPIQIHAYASMQDYFGSAYSLLPTDILGTEHRAPFIESDQNYPQFRSWDDADQLLIVATEDNTTVNIDDPAKEGTEATVVLNAGETYAYSPPVWRSMNIPAFQTHSHKLWSPIYDQSEPDPGSATFKFNVVANEPAVLSFTYWTEMSSDRDAFHLFIDDVDQTTFGLPASSSTSTQTPIFNLGPGSHEIRFEYAWDGCPYWDSSVLECTESPGGLLYRQGFAFLDDVRVYEETPLAPDATTKNPTPFPVDTSTGKAPMPTLFTSKDDQGIPTATIAITEVDDQGMSLFYNYQYWDALPQSFAGIRFDYGSPIDFSVSFPNGFTFQLNYWFQATGNNFVVEFTDASGAKDTITPTSFSTPRSWTITQNLLNEIDSTQIKGIAFIFEGGNSDTEAKIDLAGIGSTNEFMAIPLHADPPAVGPVVMTPDATPSSSTPPPLVPGTGESAVLVPFASVDEDLNPTAWVTIDDRTQPETVIRYNGLNSDSFGGVYIEYPTVIDFSSEFPSGFTLKTNRLGGYLNGVNPFNITLELTDASNQRAELILAVEYSPKSWTIQAVDVAGIDWNNIKKIALVFEGYNWQAGDDGYEAYFSINDWPDIGPYKERQPMPRDNQDLLADFDFSVPDEIPFSPGTSISSDKKIGVVYSSPSGIYNWDGGAVQILPRQTAYTEYWLAVGGQGPADINRAYILPYFDDTTIQVDLTGGNDFGPFDSDGDGTPDISQLVMNVGDMAILETPQAGAHIVGDQPFYMTQVWSLNAGTSFANANWGLTIEPVSPNVDLNVQDQDISFSNNLPNPGEQISISADIRNLRSADAGSFSVKFYEGDPGAGGTEIGSQTVASLAGESSTQVSINHTFSDEGTFEIFVVVDADNEVDEAYEDNNQASRSIVVETRPSYVLSVDAGVSYAPGDTVPIDVIANNLGTAKAPKQAPGIITLQVYDSDMNPVGPSIPHQPFTDLDPSPAETLQSSRAWAAPVTLSAGEAPGTTYTVKAVLTEDGLLYAEASAQFNLVDSVQAPLTPSVTTNKLAYSSDETVSITGKIKNNSANYTYDQLNLNFEIKKSGATIYSFPAQTVSNLLAGALKEIQLTWPTGDEAPAADYEVVMTVTGESGPVSAPFEIVPSITRGKGLKGTVTATPNVVEQTQSITFDYSVTNVGNIDIASLARTIVIVDPETKATTQLQAAPFSIPLTMGETYDNASTGYQSVLFAQIALEPKTYLVVLQGNADGTNVVIASTHFKVIEVTDVTSPTTVLQCSPACYEADNTGDGLAERYAKSSYSFSLSADDYRYVPDLDGDKDVDEIDLDPFYGCMTGDGISYAGPECNRIDFDVDGDVDPADFRIFRSCFQGSGAVPGPPPFWLSDKFFEITGVYDYRGEVWRLVSGPDYADQIHRSNFIDVITVNSDDPAVLAIPSHGYSNDMVLVTHVGTSGGMSEKLVFADAGYHTYTIESDTLKKKPQTASLTNNVPFILSDRFFEITGEAYRDTYRDRDWYAIHLWADAFEPNVGGSGADAVVIHRDDPALLTLPTKSEIGTVRPGIIVHTNNSGFNPAFFMSEEPLPFPQGGNPNGEWLHFTILGINNYFSYSVTDNVLYTSVPLPPNACPSTTAGQMGLMELRHTADDPNPANAVPHTAPVSFSPGDMTHQIYAWAEDNAGNIQADVFDVTIDDTPPAIEVTVNDQPALSTQRIYLVHGAVLEIKAADAASGVKNLFIDIDGAGEQPSGDTWMSPSEWQVGETHTVGYRAEDNLGNDTGALTVVTVTVLDKVRVITALDKSGSMSNNNRFTEMKTAVTNFINAFPTDSPDEMGIVWFNDAYAPCPLPEDQLLERFRADNSLVGLDSGNRSGLIDNVNAHTTPACHTKLYDAIALSGSVCGADPNCPAGSIEGALPWFESQTDPASYLHVLLVLSDGTDVGSFASLAQTTSAIQAYESDPDHNFIIITIGYEPAVAAEQALREIATGQACTDPDPDNCASEENFGKYFEASPSTVSDVYCYIAETLGSSCS